MTRGSTIYVRRYKQVKVLRGTITAAPFEAGENIYSVELDDGTVIGAVAIKADNQDRLAALYREQTS